MDTLLKFPFYVKASLLVMGVFVFISMLSIAQDIILPLIYATIIAILISPLVNYLVNKKVNRALAIAIVLLLVVLIVAALVALVYSQSSRLGQAWPQLKQKFQGLIEQAITWASGYFNISAQKINAGLANAGSEFMKNRSAAIGTTLTTMSGVLAGAILTPVYIFMILFYQHHLSEFIHKLFSAGNDIKVSEILVETKTIIKGYLVGLFAEFAIVAVLNSVALLILGIDYAILLGIIGAFLNAIPFIGGIIGIILFMVIALLTKSPVYVLYIIALNAIIQFIDNHYLVPKIIGSKVKLNALVAIIAVISGGALWGIPGMFLSIPLTAIIKLIFDRIESLKPWGFLLGDITPVTGEIKFAFTIKGFLPNLSSKKINKK